MGRRRWDRKEVTFRHRDALSELDPLEFERLLADYYREQGYEVEHSGTGANGSAFDGGVDLRLRKDGKLTLVQCKRDTVCQTEYNVVSQLLGNKVNEEADEAIVITSGEFTPAAVRFASQGHVQLIDGVELRRMLGHRLDRLASTAPSPAVAAAERIARYAVDELASQYAPRRRSAARDSIVGLLLLKAATVVLILILGFVVIPMILKSALTPVVQSKPPRAQPTPAPVPAPVPVAPIAATASPRSAADQAQRDAEAKAYLERVPEVTHYRYSPLEANEQPQLDGNSDRDGPAAEPHR